MKTRLVRSFQQRCCLEQLEDRKLLAFITFDYSLDTSGFFDDQARRDILQVAGDSFSTQLKDQLLSIEPSGGNSWSAKVIHPGTGAVYEIPNLRVGPGQLIVYVGSRDLGGSTAGIGGPGGYSASGSSTWFDRVKTRGQDGVSTDKDFAPWGGSIAFDTLNSDGTPSNWHFGLTTLGLSSDETDFYSTAVHELGHVLGLFGSDSAKSRISEGNFKGSNAKSEFGADIPMEANNAHFKHGTQSDGREVAMDPSISQGTRNTFTSVDWAALRDVGWENHPKESFGDAKGGMFSMRVTNSAGVGVPNIIVAESTITKEIVGTDGRKLVVIEGTSAVRTDARGYYNTFLDGGKWTFAFDDRLVDGAAQELGMTWSTTIDIDDASVTVWNVPLPDGISLVGTSTGIVGDGDLVIRANPDSVDDVVVISRNGNEVLVDVNGTAIPYDLADFSRIDVDLGIGDDELVIDYSNGDPIPAEGLVFAGGSETIADRLSFLGLNPSSQLQFNGTTPANGQLTLDGRYIVSFTDVEVVTPVRPVVNDIAVSANLINEGDFITLTGQFSDPGSLSGHTLQIIWGDGRTSNLPISVGNRSFEVTHQYEDDEPTVTSMDTYRIEVTVSDDEGLIDVAMTSVTVENVNPKIDRVDLSEWSIHEGQSVTVTGSFSDPALGVSTEHFSGTAFWSDGIDTLVFVDSSTGTFSTSRTFLDDDPRTETLSDDFTVTISIIDDDTGSDTETSRTLTVNNIDPVIVRL